MELWIARRQKSFDRPSVQAAVVAGVARQGRRVYDVQPSIVICRKKGEAHAEELLQRRVRRLQQDTLCFGETAMEDVDAQLTKLSIWKCAYMLADKKT